VSTMYKLEEATRATMYAASIKPFQRTKNKRNAWLALSNQHAGNDKWEAEIKRHEQLLHTREWKGQSNFNLERFIAQHRNAYVSMQAAAKHVTCQRCQMSTAESVTCLKQSSVMTLVCKLRWQVSRQTKDQLA
jgi:hypothetical protein